MKATVYLSRKLLNQLKVKETESKDLMLTHNLHNIINGKRVGCSGHIQNVLNNKCVYVSTEKSCYQPLSDKNMVRYAASMKDYSSVSLCTNAKHHYIDCSYDGIKCFLYGKTGYSDAFNNGAWLFTHPDLVAEFNGEPLPEQESNPEFYKTDFWTKLASWIEANMKGTSVERRQRLYNSYISDRPIQHQLTEYGLIAPDGTWYACEFGEHAALAGRIIMRNRETFGLSDHEVLNMAYDWSGKGLDFLYKRGWIAIRNPSMGNTFLDMDETKTATKAQVNTIFDYISKFNRYDMNISKVMVD